MSITQEFSTRYLIAATAFPDTEEMAQRGIYAIFRSKTAATSHTILSHMERKDRAVLLLLNGRRTLQDIARLTRRNEVEVAYILVYLLRRGYIEFVASNKDKSFAHN